MRSLMMHTAEFVEIAGQILGNDGRIEFRAHGLSMNPSISDGDILVTVPPSSGLLKRGSIIMFRDTNGLLTVHRIVGILKTDPTPRFITRGDSTTSTDGIVCMEDVLGVVTTIKKPSGVLYPQRWYQRNKSLFMMVLHESWSLLRKLLQTGCKTPGSRPSPG